MRRKYPTRDLSTPTTFKPLPDRAALQQQTRTKRMKVGLFSVGAIALVTFSMTWNPPTGSIHSFTTASDYKPEKDSGCTNSGEGCHGEESSYTDFNAYHPDSECTSCHDYQGVGCIPCHSPDGHECQSCHDGTMEKAGDRTRITDPYPRGHYRETTHTATGTSMKDVVRAAEEGSAQASCSDCHSRDLYEAHQKVPEADDTPYGDSIGCGECHNDKRSAGLDQVKSDWKKRRCEDCHAEKSSSPMHAADVAPSVEPSGGPGCASTGDGCHDVRDLHALHPDAPEDCSGSAAKGEPGCHDLRVESHQPTATACGGDADSACHAPYENERLAHEKDEDVHSPGTAVATDDSFFGIECGACHDMRDDGVSLITEHGLTTSQQANGGACRGCHNTPAGAAAVAEDWPMREETTACDACHGSSGIDETHDEDITASHKAQDSKGCADSGRGCHDTDDLSAVDGDSALHTTCLRCHDRSRAGDNLAYDPSAKSCGTGRACHDANGRYSPRTATHIGRNGRVDGLDGLHTAGAAQGSLRGTDTASGVGFFCSDCHSAVLGFEHGRPNSSIAGSAPDLCLDCHNASKLTAAVVTTGWPARTTRKACAACHTSGTAAHADIETKHRARTLDASGTASPTACATAGCHVTTDLRVLHKRTGCMTQYCHQSRGDLTGRGITTCGGPDATVACHAAAQSVIHTPHTDASGAVSSACTDSGCHGADLATAHSKTATGCFCHNSALSWMNARMKLLTAAGKAECIDCHAGSHAAHGFNASASGHNTTTYGTIGAKTRFDGSQGSLLAWESEIESASLNATWLVESGFQAATRPDGITSITIGQRGTVSTTWDFPTVNVFWRSDDPSAPADAMFLNKDSVITCQDCHAGLTAAGPHGSSDNWALDPDYPSDYSKGELTKEVLKYPSGIKLRSNFATGAATYTTGMSMICSKCHDLQNYQSGTTKNNPLPHVSTGRYASFVHDGDTFKPVRVTLPGGTSAGWYVFTDAAGRPSTVGAGQSWSVSDTGTVHSAAIGSSNTAHSSHHQDNADGSPQCVNCHIGIPHGWKAPRLLVNTGVPAFTGQYEHAVVGDQAPYLDPDHLGVSRGNLTTDTPNVYSMPWYNYVDGAWVLSSTTTSATPGASYWDTSTPPRFRWTSTYGWNKIGLLSLSAVDNHLLNAGSIQPGTTSLPGGMLYETGAAYWSEPSCQACNDHMGEDGIRIIGAE